MFITQNLLEKIGKMFLEEEKNGVQREKICKIMQKEEERGTVGLLGENFGRKENS